MLAITARTRGNSNNSNVLANNNNNNNNNFPSLGSSSSNKKRKLSPMRGRNILKESNFNVEEQVKISRKLPKLMKNINLDNVAIEKKKGNTAKGSSSMSELASKC